jgi:two-component system response regulator RegA
MEALHSERPSLLLADDDRTFCQVLARALEARGYAVETAHDGASAMRHIDANAPEYAVLDLHLPDMSGLKLVKHLVAAEHNTNIVLLTGYASIATAIDAIKLGATHYLAKPSNADEIVAAFAHGRADPRRSDRRRRPRFVAASEAARVDIELPLPDAKPMSVCRLEWEHIQRVLRDCAGNVSATARALCMHRRTLQRKLNKHAPHA